jgi:hypothetical protein
MNEQLEAKLVDDLRKCGFYSEMRTIQVCGAAGWECRGSFTYFDKDESSTRECDFQAVRQWSRVDEHDGAIHVMARLVGQVKKAQVPWIVSMDRRSKFRDECDNIIITNAPDGDRIGDIIRSHSLAARTGWAGTSIHEAFKPPTDRSRWYSAFVSVCKAAESVFDGAAVAPRLDNYFEIIQPVVVLDGLLVAAELSLEGRLVLTETDGAAFTFEYRSDAYERPQYALDVVTLDAFPRYLDLVAARMSAVTDVLRNRR